MNNDYIEVSPYDLISLSVWVNSATARTVYPIVYCYDSDYSYIGRLRGYGRAMASSYINIATQIPVMGDVHYIRTGIEINITANDEVFYIDGLSPSIIKKDNNISGYIPLLSSGLYSSSGNTSLDKKDLQMYKSFECDLDTTYASGGDATLDVVVYETDPAGKLITLGTFAQATAVSNERIALTHAMGRQMYIIYTIAGTTPEFVFQCHVTGKG
jgi:hypothetical protein